LHDQGDKTILHITHSLEEALHAKDLILLNRGRIEFCDSVARFLARERWREDYGLALPPLQQLIRDLRAQGFHIPPEITSVPELKAALLRLKERGTI
jgi:energy-coupling factor transport system ATP-binding protein